MKNKVWIFVIILIGLYSCSNNAQKENLKEDINKRPNFLFLLTDDQTYKTIHALNNSEIETPNMDKLSEQGITFTHCFNQGSWSGAVCVASRTMLITGQTVFRAPQNEVYLDKWAHSEDIKSNKEVLLWQEVFSANGYETFITGKWHNSKYAVLKNFDRGEAIGAGMYSSFDKNHSDKLAYNRSSASSGWKPWDESYTGHWTPKVNDIIYDEKGQKKIGSAYTANKHTSELYADKAINYLMTEVKNIEKPFFMYVAFNAPHDPRQSPKEFVDKYPLASIKIPENYLKEHPFDQGDHKIRDEKLAPFPRTKEAVQLHISEYYAIITHFDRELGRILKALEASGKADNTYVILSSDHGLAVGQHGLMGKQNQYDHSIRMPLIIKGPTLGRGKKVNSKVYLQSMFATTCELASIEIPETVEFKSIKDLLYGENSGGEKYIFGTYKKFQRMIRSDDYKLIIYPQIKMVQLFDLENDPNEMTNLATDKIHQKIKIDLFKKLVQKQKELGDYLVLNPSDYNL
ncbi:MAG: sulfatase [Bacteroidetes bacterium]|nr:MAG: sulfatase [Bacteroidota bacterium]